MLFPPPAVGEQTIIFGPYTVGPLTFGHVINGEYNLLEDGFYGAGQTYLEYASQDHPTQTITLAGATALSFDLGTFGAGDPLTIAVNGIFAGTDITPTEATAPYTAAFFGITSTAPITTVTITGSPSVTVFDMLSFQEDIAKSPIPEPSSLTLLAIGFAGAATTLRRKIKFLHAKKHEGT